MLLYQSELVVCVGYWNRIVCSADRPLLYRSPAVLDYVDQVSTAPPDLSQDVIKTTQSHKAQ